MPRPGAREPLLDAAERLFAQHGISNVSDRQVAEAAGNSNHSAVRYYFGGRTGLLAALMERHDDAVAPRQQQMLAASSSLLDDVRALVLPLVEVYSELAVPSWRARFLRQMLNDPSAVGVMRESGTRFAASAEVVGSMIERLADLDHDVVEGRARVTVHLVSTACAEIEERAEGGDSTGWDGVGDFLCDAIAGMLQAPITPRVAVAE